VGEKEAAETLTEAAAEQHSTLILPLPME